MLGWPGRAAVARHHIFHPGGGTGSRRRSLTLKISTSIILCTGLTAAWLGAVGTTRYVDDNTCPAAGSGTQINPYCKIQDAICNAVSGDTVSVAPGNYPESLRMKPGVSLISQTGAAATTINGAGQPCTDTNYCTKRPGAQCSVVIFGSGHATSTRLEGFTVTGGAGLPYPVASPNQINGGGIFVFSSPTIINNVITNNILSGNQKTYQGGGIYVALGAPVISNNTITGNRAVPVAGAAGNVTYGYGGGIFVGFVSDPTVTSNVITGNRAGDPNVAYSLGGGGGIAVFPGDANHIGPTITRNLVADNVTDSLGGGVSVNSLPTTAALATITNNVIVGNTAYQHGGGFYTYFNRSNAVNNTITDNTAFMGGGAFSGQNDATLPISITNNIIEGNHLQQFGNGGGLYITTTTVTLNNNDFWLNDRNHVAGNKSDATVIGTTGNISVDPKYINKASRDLHLDPNSGVIDRATATLAPTVDKDGLPRGVDGNGIPNNPVAGDNDIGAYERQGACTPTTEICDGLDNNCNLQIDEGFPDTDNDGTKDCVDTDDDNDGMSDPGDCAPLDNTAFGVPGEVINLDVNGVATSMVTYDTQNIGSGTRYEILSGLVGRLRPAAGFGEDFCVSAQSNGGTWQDSRQAPGAGDAWFYIIRAKNACGNGTLGTPQADQPRGANACQAPIVDQDNDGSPSDLDCNDTSAVQAPILPEICDNIDNDCDTVADDGNPGGGAECGSNVGQCQPGTTTCTAGSLTCVGGVGPATEVCDGLDNNCNAQSDEGFPNTDADAQADCVDPDDDNDGAMDGSDCAPLDGTAFGVPTEITDIDTMPGSPTTVTWVDQAIGSGTRYLLASGQLTASGAVSFPTAVCLGTSAASPATDSRPDPAPNTAWFYLVKSRNSCGQGTYGTPARDTIPTCP